MHVKKELWNGTENRCWNIALNIPVYLPEWLECEFCSIFARNCHWAAVWSNFCGHRGEGNKPYNKPEIALNLKILNFFNRPTQVSSSAWFSYQRCQSLYARVQVKHQKSLKQVLHVTHWSIWKSWQKSKWDYCKYILSVFSYKSFIAVREIVVHANKFVGSVLYLEVIQPKYTSCNNNIQFKFKNCFSFHTIGSNHSNEWSTRKAHLFYMVRIVINYYFSCFDKCWAAKARRKF